VFASSCCCLAASQLAVRRPALLPKLVYFGAMRSRNDIPRRDAESPHPVSFRTNLAGSRRRCLAGPFFDPHASVDRSPSTRACSARRAARKPSAIFLGRYHRDLPLCPPASLHTPALVLHRRGDRTVPISRGASFAPRCFRTRAIRAASPATRTYRTSTIRREGLRALSRFLHNEFDAGEAPPGALPGAGLFFLNPSPGEREPPRGARFRRDGDGTTRRCAFHVVSASTPCTARREHPAQARAVLPRRSGNHGAPALGLI